MSRLTILKTPIGLSYTKFTYSSIKLPSSSVKAGDPVAIEGDVKNIGSTAGNEVVEHYLTQPKASELPFACLPASRACTLIPGSLPMSD
jgi:beta-glucosidase